MEIFTLGRNYCHCFSKKTLRKCPFLPYSFLSTHNVTPNPILKPHPLSPNISLPSISRNRCLLRKSLDMYILVIYNNISWEILLEVSWASSETEVIVIKTSSNTMFRTGSVSRCSLINHSLFSRTRSTRLLKNGGPDLARQIQVVSLWLYSRREATSSESSPQEK